MTYGMADVTALSGFIEGSDLNEIQKRIERQKLNALLGYCESARCRRQVLLGYFGERDHPPCGNCDTCLAPPRTWDGLIVAQKALSAVARTGQRFGVGHLTDVLLGEPTERVRHFQHDQLKTFGVGSELDKRQWRSVFRQLVAQGHLEVDVAGHGGLRLGEDAREVLRGAAAVSFRDEPARLPRALRKRAATGAPVEPLSDVDAALFEALRAKRLALAREQGVPPYVIFHDTTLLAMARQRPRDHAALAEIPGVGRSKLERYGDIFLGVVAASTSV
jgi:ATP-dependent DNA helicase RecQ